MELLCRRCGQRITSRGTVCPACGSRIFSPSIMYYSSFLYPLLLVSIVATIILSDNRIGTLVVGGAAAALAGLGILYVRKHTPLKSGTHEKPRLE